MKCLKNNKTGNIVRVSDTQANQMVGSQWSFISKSEWKLVSRQDEQKTEELKKKEETISKKAARRSKIKAQQRPAEHIDNILK